MKTYKTEIDTPWFPAGTPVTFDEKKADQNTGKTGKLLCTMPGGGALFFSPEELEEAD